MVAGYYQVVWLEYVQQRIELFGRRRRIDTKGMNCGVKLQLFPKCITPVTPYLQVGNPERIEPFYRDKAIVIMNHC